METALTPLDFARRTRRLHGAREAVVDGDLRLSYEQFFDRCDRWSSALQARKAALFSQVVDDGDAFGGSLGADDIRALFDLSRTDRGSPPPSAAS